MVYLDYSATTTVNNKALDDFVNMCEKNISITSNLLLSEEEKIKSLLNTSLDVIYTSGATESNNWVIKSIAKMYKGKGNHIITTKLEHSSILEPLEYLKKKGYTIDFVNLTNGVVDLNHLKSLIKENTILISIASVSSEVGILQPINEIGKIAKASNVLFHSDMTQSIGKVDVPFDNVDFISFSAHKFYGLKAIGCLLKNKDINLLPLYPKDELPYPLINSLGNALELILQDKDQKYDYVSKINKEIKDFLSKYPNVVINSNNNAIPHILNISITNCKPETFQHRLEQYEVYVSTKSACSDNDDISQAVYAITNDCLVSSTSIRISLSYLTTKEEIEIFYTEIDKCIKELV